MSTTVVAILVAVAGPLLAYIAAARKLSGKIGTSEAASLWAESTKMRDEYREEVAGLKKALIECERRLAEVEANGWKIQRENDDLRRQVAEHEKTIEGLQTENTKLRKRVTELEDAT